MSGFTRRHTWEPKDSNCFWSLYMSFIFLCFRHVQRKKPMLHCTAYTVSTLFWKNAADTKHVAGETPGTESCPRGTTRFSSAHRTHSLYGDLNKPTFCRIKKPSAPSPAAVKSPADSYRYPQSTPWSYYQPHRAPADIKCSFSTWGWHLRFRAR